MTQLITRRSDTNKTIAAMAPGRILALVLPVAILGASKKTDVIMSKML